MTSSCNIYYTGKIRSQVSLWRPSILPYLPLAGWSIDKFGVNMAKNDKSKHASHLELSMLCVVIKTDMHNHKQQWTAIHIIVNVINYYITHVTVPRLGPLLPISVTPHKDMIVQLWQCCFKPKTYAAPKGRRIDTVLFAREWYVGLIRWCACWF